MRGSGAVGIHLNGNAVEPESCVQQSVYAALLVGLQQHPRHRFYGDNRKTVQISPLQSAIHQQLQLDGHSDYNSFVFGFILQNRVDKSFKIEKNNLEPKK